MKKNNSTLKISRRQALGSVMSSGVVLGVAACSKNDLAYKKTTETPSFEAPPLPQNLLVNRERAHQIMQASGVDAILCSRPDNIYYLTNYYPQLAKMGMENLVYAILPLDRRQAPILVIGQFEYYLAATQGATTRDVDVRLYTMPADAERFASQSSLAAKLDSKGFSSFLPTVHDLQALSSTEKYKQEETTFKSRDMGATGQTSFLKALRDIPHKFKRFAIDDMSLSDQIKSAEIDVSFANGEQMLRRIRLTKSSAEVELMTYAANANAQAGLAAAKIARDGATFQDIRREFNRQCVDRFLTPEFMVIDSVIPENAPGKIKEGRSFAIDCVSHGQHYHGDYGRTVCVGEPTGAIKRATDAIAQVWDDLLPQLKPGLRYSEIGALATQIFKKTNSEAALICNPHSVGLQHTDEPSVEGSTFFQKDDLELMDGMVISVDLPVIDLGLGGSAHLEDLVLISKDGATLLNSAENRLIIV